MFSFCSFSSGSSGNCYLVQSENTAILIDAGISGKKILEGLEIVQTDVEKVKGVLVTHEHVDHVKSLHVALKKLPLAKGYANLKTWNEIKKDIKDEKKEYFDTGEMFTIGDIEIRPFSISHDAVEPVGFSLFAEGKQISIITDTGYIDEEMFREIEEADILVLESNHDEEILKMGSYPWHVKQRVLSDKGHLSNVAAGNCLCKWIGKAKCNKERMRKIFLAHISRENNFPEMAMQTIKNILEEGKHYGEPSIQISTILKDQVTILHEA